MGTIHYNEVGIADGKLVPYVLNSFHCMIIAKNIWRFVVFESFNYLFVTSTFAGIVDDLIGEVVVADNIAIEAKFFGSIDRVSAQGVGYYLLFAL